MSTYPLRKLVPDATKASVCFLSPSGSQMIYLGAKKILFFLFFFLVFRVGLATVKTLFLQYFLQTVELADFVSTYPLRKLIPDATMASVCFLLPPGSQMIHLGAKKNSLFFFFYGRVCHAQNRVFAIFLTYR